MGKPFVKWAGGKSRPWEYNMKFFVNIEETVNGIFEVEANSKDEAFDIARQRYYNCEFVNEPGKLTCVQASLMAKDGEFKEWLQL